MSFLLRLLLLLDLLGPKGLSPPLPEPAPPPATTQPTRRIGGTGVTVSGVTMGASGSGVSLPSGVGVTLSGSFAGNPVPNRHLGGAESLEWAVADSPIVARVRLESKAADNELTLKVLECIKGTLKKGDTIKLYPALAAGLPHEALVFLEPNKRPDAAAHPLRMRPRGDFIYDWLDLEREPEVLLMDFSRLTSPEQILKAARLAAAHPQAEPAKSVTLQISTTTGPFDIRLTVPADERLEKLARQWMAQSSVDARLIGLQAIQPFKSTANIELVTRLLSDTRPRIPASMRKWQMTYYYVRAAANDVLLSWKVLPPELPDSGPVLQYQHVSISRWQIAVVGASCLAWLLCSYAASRWANARGIGLSLRHLNIAAISLALAVCASWLWVRSHSRVDELMFSLDQSHHEVASYDGGIQYCVVREWTLPPNTVLGHFDREMSEDIWSIDRMNRSSTTTSMGFVVTKGLLNGPAKVIHPFTLFRLPYWALLTPLTIVLTIVTFKMTRSIIRARRGLCRNCGYDLRESQSGPCPECGNSIARKPSSPALVKTPDKTLVGQAV